MELIAKDDFPDLKLVKGKEYIVKAITIPAPFTIPENSTKEYVCSLVLSNEIEIQISDIDKYFTYE